MKLWGAKPTYAKRTQREFSFTGAELRKIFNLLAEASEKNYISTDDAPTAVLIARCVDARRLEKNGYPIAWKVSLDE